MKKLIVLLAAFSGLVFSSCRKTPDFGQLSSELVVVTNRDNAAHFNDYKTYYISDTVANLGGSGADTILTDDNAKTLVQTVKDNMNARGYVYADRSTHPDLGIQIGVVKVNTTVEYPGWWDGSYGWWDPWYWGWYYPYYYPWTTVYSYSTGTIIVNMYDIKNAQANQNITGIWNNIDFGALGSSTSTNITRAVNAINQGFEQSPYVNAN
jgi:hypothetical protein